MRISLPADAAGIFPQAGRSMPTRRAPFLGPRTQHRHRAPEVANANSSHESGRNGEEGKSPAKGGKFSSRRGVCGGADQWRMTPKNAEQKDPGGKNRKPARDSGLPQNDAVGFGCRCGSACIPGKWLLSLVGRISAARPPGAGEMSITASPPGPEES